MPYPTPVIGKQAAIDRLARFRETLGIVGFISYEVGSVAVVGEVIFYDAVLDGKVTSERYYHG